MCIFVYSYPGCCVAKSPPVIAPSRNSDAIALLFVNDLHNRMPYVCGSNITYSSKPVIPFASLQSAHNVPSLLNIRPVPVKPTLQVLSKVHVSMTIPLGLVCNWFLCWKFSIKQLKLTHSLFQLIVPSHLMTFLVLNSPHLSK